MSGLAQSRGLRPVEQSDRDRVSGDDVSAQQRNGVFLHRGFLGPVLSHSMSIVNIEIDALIRGVLACYRGRVLLKVDLQVSG